MRNKILFLIAVLAASLWTAPAADGVLIRTRDNLIERGNTHYVGPDQDLAVAYDYLASSERDSRMGALTYFNRRTLVLAPGTYTVTACLAVDTEHVDITDTTPGDPFDTVITCSAADNAVMKQTAADVQMSGFTVRNTSPTAIPMPPADGGTSDVTRGLIIENEVRNEGASISGTSLTKTDSDLGVKVVDANQGHHPDEVFVWDLDGGVTAGWYDIASVTDDDTVVLASAPGDSAGDVFYDICFQHSTYRNMAFHSNKLDAGSGDNSLGGIGSRGNMGGLYENLTLGNSCLRTRDRNIADWFYVAGDLYNVSIDEAAAVDLGGGLVGIPITGHKIRPHSYIKIINTTAYNGYWPVHSVTTNQIKIEMPFTTETFGADDLADFVWLSSHRIKARHITGSNYCYGGDTLAEFAADYAYVTGVDYCFNGCTQWGAPMRDATLRYCTARDRSFALSSWILEGTLLEHCTGRYGCFAGDVSRIQSGKFWGTGRWLKAEYSSTRDSFGAGDYGSGGKNYMTDFARTASLRALAENWQYGTDAEWKAGTRQGGRYDEFDTDNISIRDCHPPKFTACTANTDVWVLDNGHTFTNKGAGGTVTFDLPYAIKGLKFTFIRVETGAGKDVYVNPLDADDITLTDNTTLANGKYWGNEDDKYGLLTVECFDNGHWYITKEVGTWMSEA